MIKEENQNETGQKSKKTESGMEEKGSLVQNQPVEEEHELSNALNPKIGNEQSMEIEQKNQKMKYLQEEEDSSGLPMIPASPLGKRALFSSQLFYVSLRYHYAIYERFAKAKELSKKFEEDLELSENEKEELAKKRYTQFKALVLSQLNSRVDESASFEEMLRGLFDKDAYVLFTVCRTVQNVSILSGSLDLFCLARNSF